MSRRGGHSYGHGTNHWQGSHNPNMAPLPLRPRGGIGSSNNSYNHSASPHSGYGSPHIRASSHNDTRSPLPDHAAPSASTSTGPEVATTLFVGSISPGISDTWLTKLLEACGTLRSLKRASKAFGFAEYADPDSVLRAIQVLQGRELPSMGAEASAPRKKLLVKADERTKKFLDKYEQTRVASSDDKGRETRALSAVKDIIRQMEDPNAQVETDPSKPGYVVPDHLKDLPPEELPEDQRATVLGEIEQFRQAAAARDAETRRREAEYERQRAIERARRENLQASSSSSRNGRSSDDPQSYRRPVDFHAASSYDAKADVAREPEERDEIEHQERLERKKAAARAAAADAERAYSARERQRLAHWEKEQDRSKAEDDKWERDGVAFLRRCEDWSDEMATRKELFYTDRQRWRQFRASARRREEEADERDRQLEAEEKAKAQQETEKFLAQQAEDMAKLTEQQRQAGVLPQTHGGSLAPIKLNFGIKPADSSTTTAAGGGDSDGAVANGSGAKPSTALLGEPDEDDSTKRTGRLKHIQLSSTMSDEEKAARLAQLSAGLPQSTASLFEQSPRWEWVDEALIQRKYRAWVDREIEESLGEKVEELVNVVIEGLQAHQSAQALVEMVEPVLAEEAQAFVDKLWRLVVVDSMAAAEGIPI